MSDGHFTEFQTTASQGTVAGFWKLAHGRALSLLPHQPGVLRVAQGQAWVTLGTAPHGAGNELGDYFLHAGEQLSVRPGQHLVLEPVAGGQPQDAVYFDWTPTALAGLAPAARGLDTVAQPLRDLRLALAMVGTALVQLCAGLLSYGRQRLLGRPVVVQAAPCHLA